MQRISSAAYADSKPHYELLDGLRGVAALLVICYHIFEGFATSPVDQRFNHGYLAVDFFFLLSGFVIGYAYDDRWKRGMRCRDFIRRRLIRLHPMVILGAVFGAAAFWLQGSVRWDGTPVSAGMLLLALLCGMVLLPVWPGAGHEVRGNGEMYPLNGPSWSLFFEYLGNLLYAFLLRRLPTRLLALVVVLSGSALTLFAVCDLSGYGHLGVGWTLADYNLPGGLLRMLFCFRGGSVPCTFGAHSGSAALRWPCCLQCPMPGARATICPTQSTIRSASCCSFRCCSGSAPRAVPRTVQRHVSAGFWVTYPIRSTSCTILRCTSSMPGSGSMAIPLLRRGLPLPRLLPATSCWPGVV